ncbi:MAG: hypothetical protein WBE26_01970 [Phycisphaerae bacterium]
MTTQASRGLQPARCSAQAKACGSPRLAFRSTQAIVSGLCLLYLGVMIGCARPQGVLFPAIDSPQVWPPSPDQPRIKLLGTLADSRDLKAAESGMEVFRATLRGSRPPIKFSGPHAVAIRSPGVLAVADGAGSGVHVIDLNDRTHRLVTGFADERFAAPIGVTWAGQRLFVADAQRHEVIELDAGGGFHQRFGGEVLNRPVGIAYVAERNQLYVVDGGAHVLNVFDLSGMLVKTVGRRGSAPGEFNFPTHICCAGNRLLVADSGSFRVQLLDLDGACLKTIGQKGDGAGDFSLPKGVALDSEGHIYVVDAQFENVQIFNDAGQLLMAFGEEGSRPGRFSLPAGLAIDDQDRIWVADSGNRRLQVFAYMRTSS